MTINPMEQHITKKEVSHLLDEIGMLLELAGENPFKSRAYYQASRTIDQLDRDIHDVVQDGSLSAIKGIGTALSQKITEYVTTGRLAYYDELKSRIPPGLCELVSIPGLGPRKVKKLYDILSITTVGELEYACLENRLVDLPGFGKKSQEKFLTGIQHYKLFRERRLYSDTIDEALSLLSVIRGLPLVVHASLAGSLRRLCETVKDIDILASAEMPGDLSRNIAALPHVQEIIAQGSTKVSVRMISGIAVDIRIVSPAEFPYALHHFTGSKEHNTAMRSRAKKRGLKMNEYGLFANGSNIPCADERDIFTACGLAYIPPELRENRGEVEAAETGTLPHLITEKDIRGILHIHTNFSDGADSIDVLARTAIEKGYDYIGISDHSQSAFYAGGLSEDEIVCQHELIDQLNKKYGNFRIFKGIEADILPDGRLDYDDAVLSTFDFVIAAVHTRFDMSEEDMTDRILQAMDNRFTTILAHPTGRLLLSRPPYAVSMERIIDHAAQRGTIMELNANPLRLDIDWRVIPTATAKGVTIAINPDAHDRQGIAHISLGVNIARKGWLSPEHCINTLSVQEISRLFKNIRYGN